MAEYKAVNAEQLDSDLKSVADSIRSKGGTSGSLTFPEGFKTAVANIKTGNDAKEEQDKTLEITENGEHKIFPDEGKVLSSATAKVNVPERYDEGYNEGYSSGFGAGVNSVKLQEKTVTENGDVLPDEGFNGMSKVTVAVPVKEEQEKSITITENGTTEVIPDEGKTLSKVTVETNVSGGGEVGKPYLDTRLITNFSAFFNLGHRLDIVPYIDTSKGTNLSSMLSGCTGLSTVPHFDTSKCTDFTSMFLSCTNLITIPQLDISMGTSFTSTFAKCSKLTTVSLTTASNDLKTDTFYNCTALTNLTIGEGWGASIYLTYSNNLSVESLHGMIENLADLTGQTAKTFQVGATNLAKIDEEHIAMLNAKNWVYS